MFPRYCLIVLLSAAGVLVTCTAACSCPPPQAKPIAKCSPVRTDRFGDPLPAGALARIGTVRLRSYFSDFALSPDASLLALLNDDNTVGLCRLPVGTQLYRLASGGEESIYLGGFSSHGTMLSTTSGRTVDIWHVATGKRLWQDHGPLGFGKGVFSPDEKNFAAWAPDGVLHVWEAETGKPLRKLAVPGDAPPRQVRFTADGKTVTVVTEEKCVSWDMASGKEFATRVPQPSKGRPVLAPDGRSVAVIGPQRIMVYRGERDTIKAVGLPLNDQPVDDVQFFPDSKSLVSVNYRRSTIRVWPIGRSGPPSAIKCDSEIASFHLSPDGRTLATATATARIFLSIDLWDVTTGKCLLRLPEGVSQAQSSLAFSADGKLLVVRSSATFRFWQVATGEEHFGFEGPALPVQRLAFSPDGRMLATGGPEGAVQLWDTATGQALRRLPGHKGASTRLAFSQDGKTLASWTEKEAVLWEVATGRQRRRFTSEALIDLTVSRNGTTLAALTNQQPGLTLRDVTKGTKHTVLKLPYQYSGFPGYGLLGGGGFAGGGGGGPSLGSYFASPAFSPDGRSLAVHHFMVTRLDVNAVPEHLLDVWDVASGKPRRGSIVDYAHSLSPSSQLLISPDGRVLASVDDLADTFPVRAEGSGICLWEMATGRPIGKFHEPYVHGTVLFTSPARLLAIVKDEEDSERLDLWDVLGNKRLLSIRVPGEITSLALSPDGCRLATAMTDATVLIWDLRDPRGPGPPVPLAATDLQRLWADLASSEATRGFRAVQTLSAAPKAAVAFLKERLRPHVPPSDDPVQLIADLDAKKLTVRQTAFQRLAEQGKMAEKALRSALATNLPLEVHRRLSALLTMLQTQPPPTVLRHIRAVQVLETIGSEDAQKVLAALACGPTDATLTQEARGSVERLARKLATAR